jgi:serine/threonine protein kinase
LGEEEALKIIKPIAKAVEYIHSEYRLLHLDIKPDNIMMLGDKPVLIDFGISLHFNKKGNLTSTNKSLLGSVGYAPIEQMTNQGITSFAPEADVYALGATLYYMLVGKDPISAFEVRPEFIEKELMNRGVSEKVCKAIVHAMQPKREDRTKYAYAFLKELEKGSESNKPKSNNPLPANYVLHLGNTDYLIIRVVETTDYYVKYQAVRYTGHQSGSDSNLTVKKTYNIYEYFAKSVHQRQEDNTVAVTSGVSSPKENFIALASKHKIPRDNTFETNGTLYFIETAKPPVPPKSKWKWILVACIIIISLGVNMLRLCNGKETEVSPNNEDSVSKTVVKKDSGTTVKPVIEKKENNDKKEIVEVKKAENTNTEEPVQAKMTEEEIYTLAIQANDWKSMRTLAKKNYAPACGALAKHYVNDIEYPTQIDLCRAYYWALKSSDKDRIAVINSLKKQYFFASDGKPAYPCDNIDY